jgi:hypothetical protein
MAKDGKIGHDGAQRLLAQHLSDLLKSGLGDDQIRACGFTSVSDPHEIAKLLGWRHPARKIGPCLRIPYRNADGTLNCYCRLKPDRPRPAKAGGKPVKYEAPRGTPNRAFFPPGTIGALSAPAKALLVTEGEKKAAKADQEGFPCIGLAGVYAWQKKRPRKDGKATGPRELIDDLVAVCWSGREVIVAFDSDAADNPNVRWAEWHLAEVLRRRGATVKIVRLPPAPPGPGGEPAKVGLDDYLVAHGPDAFRELLKTATPPRRPERSQQDDAKPAKAARKSASTRLVELVLQSTVELFHDPGGTAYGSIAFGDRRETWPLRSSGFRRYLNRLFFELAGKTAGGQAIQDAIATLEGQATFGAPQYPVHVRVAESDGKVYLDLADDRWRAVEISANGWRVVTDPPVKFRRPRGMLPLPEPTGGVGVDALREFVNVPDDDDWQLVVAWMVQALRPRGPYPVIFFHGEQGCAKSTTGRAVRMLLDPRVAPMRSEPRDERDLMIAATNSWVLAFDNLSELPRWLSDALCRLATGGGFSTRQLYTDDEEVIFDAMRPCLLTGIEDLASRGDLLERGLVLRLPTISESRRRSEASFWPAFEAVRPQILGALLDVASGVIRDLPGVRLPCLPRMADFAQVATAAEPALGWQAGSFLRSYSGNREAANDLALEASPLAGPIRVVAAAGGFEGTATELLARLAQHAAEKVANSRQWPKTGQALSGALRRLAPNLRKVGVLVDFRREPGGERRRMVTIRSEGVGPDDHENRDAFSRPDRPVSSPQAPAGTQGHRPGTQNPSAGTQDGDGFRHDGTIRDGRDGDNPAFSPAPDPRDEMDSEVIE